MSITEENPYERVAQQGRDEFDAAREVSGGGYAHGPSADAIASAIMSHLQDERDGRDWLRDLIGKVTYRPGWSFDVQNTLTDVAPWGPIWIVNINWVVPNNKYSAGLSPVVRIAMNFAVPYADAQARDVELVYRKLWDAIAALEAHERMEDLKLEGVPIYDPHPGSSRAARTYL